MLLTEFDRSKKAVIIPNLTRGVRPYAFVENVVPHADYRGKGYATACLNYAREGCYIPFDWQRDFEPEYLAYIRYRCLIMSRNYIESHFEEIRHHGNVIEQRLDDSGLNKTALVLENEQNLRLCQENGCPYILLEDSYSIELEDIMR